MIISIVNQKGGTGKTTTTINLAVAMANAGMKVLALDMDPQGSLSYSFGLDEADHTIVDLLQGKSPRECIINKEGVDIIPSNITLASVKVAMVNAQNRESILRNALKEGITGYDFIVIDCPPTLSLLTVNALTASQQVIIPLQLEVLSVRGLDQIIDSIEKIRTSLNKGLSIMGILPVMVDKRKKLSQEVLDYITDSFQAPIFQTRIRINVRLSEAPSFAKSALKYSPDCAGSKDYMDLAKEIIFSPIYKPKNQLELNPN